MSIHGGENVSKHTTSGVQGLRESALPAPVPALSEPLMPSLLGPTASVLHPDGDTATESAADHRGSLLTPPVADGSPGAHLSVVEASRDASGCAAGPEPSKVDVDGAPAHCREAHAPRTHSDAAARTSGEPTAPQASAQPKSSAAVPEAAAAAAAGPAEQLVRAAVHQTADIAKATSAAERHWMVLRSIDCADAHSLESEGTGVVVGERDKSLRQDDTASALLPAPSRNAGRDVVAARSAHDRQRADWEAALASAAGTQQHEHRRRVGRKTPKQRAVAGGDQHANPDAAPGSDAVEGTAQQQQPSSAPERGRRRPTNQAAVRAGIRVLEAAAESAKGRKAHRGGARHRPPQRDVSAPAVRRSRPVGCKRMTAELHLLQRGRERMAAVIVGEVAQQRPSAGLRDVSRTAAGACVPASCEAGAFTAPVAQLAAESDAQALQPAYAMQI